MLLTKEVEVGLRGNKKILYYREKGYKIPMVIGKKGKPVVDYSQPLFVKIEDMPEYSEAKVTVKCDYQEEGCRDIYPKNVADYIKNNLKSIIHKDCCSNKKCISKKTAECNMINFGFEYHINQPEFIEKQKQTNLEIYGVDNVFASEHFKITYKQIIQDKYGVDNISQNEDIKIKKAETFYRNGTVRTSRQQIYVHQLLGGILNYSNDTPSLDIAFPDNKIYIELNGSGHDLCVKMGQKTQQQFNNREIRRYYYMKKLGWKGIFINTGRDYLPSDEVMMQEYNKALEWFKSEEKYHSHYNIDIGGLMNDKVYGKLRRITEKDLKEVI